MISAQSCESIAAPLRKSIGVGNRENRASVGRKFFISLRLLVHGTAVEIVLGYSGLPGS